MAVAPRSGAAERGPAGSSGTGKQNFVPNASRSADRQRRPRSALATLEPADRLCCLRPVHPVDDPRRPAASQNVHRSQNLLQLIGPLYALCGCWCSPQRSTAGSRRDRLVRDRGHRIVEVAHRELRTRRAHGPLRESLPAPAMSRRTTWGRVPSCATSDGEPTPAQTESPIARSPEGTGTVSGGPLVRPG